MVPLKKEITIIIITIITIIMIIIIRPLTVDIKKTLS